MVAAEYELQIEHKEIENRKNEQNIFKPTNMTIKVIWT